MNIDSSHIKEGLMHYFRFKRGWTCADEVYSGNFIGDIVVDTGKYTIEIEIKTSKSDLIQGEARKTTYYRGMKVKKHEDGGVSTNKFALCVPESLKEVAEQWIENTNKKYGLYIYSGATLVQDTIFTYKRAGFLHKDYDPKKYLYKIAKRLSGARAFELSSNRTRNKGLV